MTPKDPIPSPPTEWESGATPAPEGGYADAAVGGVAWVGLYYVLGRGILLVSFIVIARELAPDEFGLFAAAFVFITYAGAFYDMGVGQALVFHGGDRRLADAALAVSILISGVLAATGALTAPWVAGFFGREEVAPLIRVLSLSLLLSGLSVVPDALLRAQLRFRRRFVAQISGVTAQAVVTTALGIAGAGAWSLVWGWIAGIALSGVLGWSLAGYRPSARFWHPSPEIVRALVAYGAPLAGHTLLLTLVADIDYLIVGRRLGSVALAFYAVAFRIPQMVVTNLFFIFTQVLFPIYSKMRRDRARLQRGFVAAVRVQSLAGATIGAFLAVMAPVLVPTVFGAKWSPSIAPLQALAFYAAFRSFAGGAANIFNAMGRPRLALWSSLAQLVVLVPALFLATAGGIESVAWTHAGMALLIALSLLGIAGHLVGLGVRGLARTLAPALAAGAGTAAAVAAVRFFLPGPDLLRIAVAAIAGTVGGLAMFTAADRRFAFEVAGLLRTRFRRRGADGPVESTLPPEGAVDVPRGAAERTGG